MNAEILNLLENLQEYVQTQANLQSDMSDGYMALAQSRRLSTGAVLPDTVLSVEQETRRICTKEATLPPNEVKFNVCGVTDTTIKEIQNYFERSLETVIKLVTIKEQINEKYMNLKEKL